MRKYSIRAVVSYSMMVMLGCGSVLQAQTPQTSYLTYHDYLEKVNAGNLDYAAQKLNVSAARADVIAAHVFNDPQISVDYTNNQDHALHMGQSVEVGITQTLSMGKRGAGIRMARSESELSETLLADYFRNLRADATIAFFEVQKQKQLYEVKRSSYKDLLELAKSDSIRFATGKIMEVEAIQSKLEAGIMHNEVIQAETDLKNACCSLSLMMGTLSKDTLYLPKGELGDVERPFSLDHLMTYAVDNRADLVAALKNTEVARRAVTVARRDKLPDVDVSLSVSHNNRVRNEEAPAPNFNGITAGIAFPLKFSAFNKGTVQAAKFRAQQAEAQYNQARLQVQTEVVRAYQQFQSLSVQVKHYRNGMLSQAKEVLKGKVYSYNRGEVPLLEILNAQRTYDEVQAQYIETLYNYNVALAELERTAGIWDIQ